jgi:hypothetical protein
MKYMTFYSLSLLSMIYNLIKNISNGECNFFMSFLEMLLYIDV